LFHNDTAVSYYGLLFAAQVWARLAARIGEDPRLSTCRRGARHVDALLDGHTIEGPAGLESSFSTGDFAARPTTFSRWNASRRVQSRGFARLGRIRTPL
jgi:hypothetical protein